MCVRLIYSRVEDKRWAIIVMIRKKNSMIHATHAVASGSSQQKQPNSMKKEKIPKKNKNRTHQHGRNRGEIK